MEIKQWRKFSTIPDQDICGENNLETGEQKLNAEI